MARRSERGGRDRSRTHRRGTRDAQHHRSPKSERHAPSTGTTDIPRRFSDSADVRSLLAGIGQPEPAPFQPDSFQLEALAALEFHDVLVTAPTGSGKTWIAREEIRRLLKDGRRAWYTSPLKALTNSKYQEFIDEFGAARVGILTGDRKENWEAPLIVGTTEIYRNQLFDSLRGG